MNGAEFKTLRESVGLTAAAVALIGDVKLRTVQYWESGRSEPPEDVIDVLGALQNQISERAAVIVERTERIEKKAQQQAKAGGGNVVYSSINPVLVRYQTDEDFRQAAPEEYFSMTPGNLQTEPNWNFSHRIHAALIRHCYLSLHDQQFWPSVKYYSPGK